MEPNFFLSALLLLTIMIGFLGTYNINLDNKNRFNVPAKFKTVLDRQESERLVICIQENKAKGKYLKVYPEKQWEENQRLFEGENDFDEGKQEEVRRIYAKACECEIKSGKILIPAYQREEAGLKKEAVLIGMSRTFELWKPERWAIQSG